MKRLLLSLSLVALLLLLTNIPTASDCAPPLEIGVKPLPPEVSAILSVHGGEVLVSEDGTITVTNPAEPPKRFRNGAAILQHPWGAELRKNTSNYGIISHMRAGPSTLGTGTPTLPSARSLCGLSMPELRGGLKWDLLTTPAVTVGASSMRPMDGQRRTIPTIGTKHSSGLPRPMTGMTWAPSGIPSILTVTT